MRARPLAVGMVAVTAAALIAASSTMMPHVNPDNNLSDDAGGAPALGRGGNSMQSPNLNLPADALSSQDDDTPQNDPQLAINVVDAVNAVAPKTAVGVAVYDRQTDTVVTEANAHSLFYTASVVKLLIAIDLLHQAGWQVGENDRLTLEKMLGASDDAVATTSWKSGGGPKIVQRMAELIGISDVAAPAVTDEWEMTQLSARAVTTIYRYIVEDIPEPARAVIVESLTRAGDTAADGFDQFFGIPGAWPSPEWSVKQGWMRAAGRLILHSTGMVGADQRHIVVVLTSQPSSQSYANGAAAVTAGAAVLVPSMVGG